MFADSALIIKSYEKYSYKELLKVRDDLVEDMRNFENDRFPPDLWQSDAKPDEAFEVQTTSDSQEQYVLLPQGKKFIKVELIYVNGGVGEVIAFSPVIAIPQGATLVNDLQPGRQEDFSPVEELSGIRELITEQYKNHRHSFS